MFGGRVALRRGIHRLARERMDYTGLVKSLDLPPGFTAPRELTYEDIRA